MRVRLHVIIPIHSLFLYTCEKVWPYIRGVDADMGGCI